MVFEFLRGITPEVDALNLSVACVVFVSLQARGWIKYKLKLKLYPPPALRATSSFGGQNHSTKNI
jgi:hypothetical protein